LKTDKNISPFVTLTFADANKKMEQHITPNIWFRYAPPKCFALRMMGRRYYIKFRIPPLNKQLYNLCNNINSMKYKHTQISYLMLAVTLVVLILFAWTYITARAEPPSYYSGTNFAVTATMTLIIFMLASFVSLQVIIDEKYLRIKFGYGIYKKSFLLNDIVSAKTVRNHWYYGWGIRVWFWPKMWIYNISGFDAVEIKLKNGKTYRIGTNEPKKLEQTIFHSIK